MLGLLLGDTGSGAVNCPIASLENNGTTYNVSSGIKFDADGDVYRMTILGAWQRIGTWLINGTNSDYYISRTIDSGSLDTDAGAGPLQMNSDRAYAIVQTTVGTSTAMISVTISNSTTGSPVLDGKSYTLKATRESGA